MYTHDAKWRCETDVIIGQVLVSLRGMARLLSKVANQATSSDREVCPTTYDILWLSAVGRTCCGWAAGGIHSRSPEEEREDTAARPCSHRAYMMYPCAERMVKHRDHAIPGARPGLVWYTKAVTGSAGALWSRLLVYGNGRSSMAMVRLREESVR